MLWLGVILQRRRLARARAGNANTSHSAAASISVLQMVHPPSHDCTLPGDRDPDQIITDCD